MDEILCRFVNTVLNSELDENLIWSHIKTLRLNYLMKNADLTCDNAFISQVNISTHFEKLSHMAGVVISSEQFNRNFSKSNIDTAAKMFVYLNSCPSFFVKLYWKAIFGPKSRIVMLASNIIKKTNAGFIPKAVQIFAKMTRLLGFEYISYYKGNGHFGENIKNERKTLNVNVTDKKLLQTVINHPVHILNNEEELSSSSFIPFCSFGEDFVGSKVNPFDIPVCNIFNPRIVHDQFCFETDLQELRSNNSQILKEQLTKGLTLVLDYNEERQSFNFITKDAKKSLYHYSNSVSIYLNTISIEIDRGSIGTSPMYGIGSLSKKCKDTSPKILLSLLGRWVGVVSSWI